MRSVPRALVALVAAVVLLAGACSRDDGGADTTAADGAASAEGASPGAELAVVSGPTVAGGEIDGASLTGVDTVLWFWAPWCTVCRAEAPNVTAAADAIGGEVTVVGVASRDGVEAMQAFVDETGVDGLDHLVDEEGDVWRAFGVTSQPAFAFVDDSGEVLDVHVGALGEEALLARMQDMAAS